MGWLIWIVLICSVHLQLLSSVESTDCKEDYHCGSEKFKCPNLQRGICGKEKKCECLGTSPRDGNCTQTADCKPKTCGKYVPSCDQPPFQSYKRCVCVEPDDVDNSCSSYSQCRLCHHPKIRRCIDEECECYLPKKDGEPCEDVEDCEVCHISGGPVDVRCVKKENGDGKVCKCMKQDLSHITGECDNDDVCANKFCKQTGKVGECRKTRDPTVDRCYCYNEGCQKLGACKSKEECRAQCCYGYSKDNAGSGKKDKSFICKSFPPLQG